MPASSGRSSSRRTPRASTSSSPRRAHAEEGDMIVRIMGEGQVRLADSHLTELNELDDELLA
ncbi:hypothetical protein NGM37_50635, partial [Streptomyces sp. TRM76130]|nr:hypothetical protein [Streptomyces sp. TRM76130]